MNLENLYVHIVLASNLKFKEKPNRVWMLPLVFHIVLMSDQQMHLFLPDVPEQMARINLLWGKYLFQVQGLELVIWYSLNLNCQQYIYFNS